MSNLFLSEIANSKLMIQKSFISEFEILLKQGNRDKQPDFPVLKFSSALGLTSSDSGNYFDKVEKDSIVVIPIIGTMFKYNSWWSYGMDYFADLIRQANASENVSGIILLINTPGGSTQSLIQLEDAMRNLTKPCVAVVDGMCCSCGIYIASFADRIVALNRMCEIGSIGVFVQFVDFSKYYEKEGIKIIEVYPSESTFKNKGVRDAIKGDDKYLIDESLSPFAEHFQEIIKANRPKLDTLVEGILEGKVFYAYHAVENGLIDSVMNLEQSIALVRQLADEQQQLKSLFN